MKRRRAYRDALRGRTALPRPGSSSASWSNGAGRIDDVEPVSPTRSTPASRKATPTFGAAAARQGRIGRSAGARKARARRARPGTNPRLISSWRQGRRPSPAFAAATEANRQAAEEHPEEARALPPIATRSGASPGRQGPTLACTCSRRFRRRTAVPAFLVGLPRWARPCSTCSWAILRPMCSRRYRCSKA